MVILNIIGAIIKIIGAFILGMLAVFVMPFIK